MTRKPKRCKNQAIQENSRKNKGTKQDKNITRHARDQEKLKPPSRTTGTSNGAAEAEYIGEGNGRVENEPTEAVASVLPWKNVPM